MLKFSTYQIPLLSIKFLCILGFASFTVFFFIASLLYPGGSMIHPSDDYYKWNVNYICDLSKDIAFNGLPNKAKTMFILGISCLCSSIAITIFRFAKFNLTILYQRRTLQFTGIGSMLSGMLLFTQVHDQMVLPVFILSLITSVMMIIKLVEPRSQLQFNIGILCYVLLVLNYYIFLSEDFIWILPILQKFTLGIFITWFISINLIAR